MIRLTILMGTAKPMFCPSVLMAVLMPTTLTLEVQQGPSGIAPIDGGIGLDKGFQAAPPAEHAPTAAFG